MTRIVVLNGHPDGSPGRLCHAIAARYREAAEAAGHEVRVVSLAELDVPLLESRRMWEEDPLPESLKRAQEDLLWGRHWVVVYPLWMGSMPAKLKAFFERVLQPGLSFIDDKPRKRWMQMLSGRSARIIVTMGMPAAVYRTFFAMHSVKSFERNILGFVGLRPVRTYLLGNVDGRSEASMRTALAKVARFAEEAR